MTVQNTEGLIEDIKRVGCLFLSLMRIVELETSSEFAPYQVNFVWNISKMKKYLNSKNECKNPDGIIKEFFYLTNKPRSTFAQVGISKQGNVVFWEWAKNVYANYKYQIEKVKTNGSEGTHFRLCDAKKQIIYDSYSFKKYDCEVINEYTLYTEIK